MNLVNFFGRKPKEPPASGEPVLVPCPKGDEMIRKGGWRICTRLEDRNHAIGWVYLEPFKPEST